jgi:DNA methylase
LIAIYVLHIVAFRLLCPGVGVDISNAGTNRLKELAMHPTVKPAALVADAIRDCSRRGEIVLDDFGNSGTTLIAAESCRRSARLIECDPAYCDTIITRWERLTGKHAVHAESPMRFEEIAEERMEATPTLEPARDRL